MIWRLVLRYSFSPVNGHRGRALRIVISFALSHGLCLAVYEDIGGGESLLHLRFIVARDDDIEG